jgi:hypothetical protein
MERLETFDTFEGHHMLTRDRAEHPLDAHVVMREAGALFDVAYPASMFEECGVHGLYGGYHTPYVKKGVNKDKPLHKYVVRLDTGDVLGLHSHTYAETDGYSFIADMAEEMFPESTTSCTVFGNGEKIAVTQDLVNPVDLGDGDIIQSQVCWITSYNGVWPTAVYDLTSRLFCQNQLVGQMPLVRVKHTKNHDQLLEMRIRILEGSIARAKTVSAMARVLRDQEYSDEQFDRLVSQILPVNHTEMTERQANNVLTRQQYCRGAWYKEKEEFGAGNRWLAYNAVQGAEQHRINGRVRGGTFSRDRALEKAIDQKTPLAEKALALLSA